MNCDNLETLVIEIDNAKDKNVIVSLVFMPPNGSIKLFHEYLKLFLDKTTISNKNVVLMVTLIQICLTFITATS